MIEPHSPEVAAFLEKEQYFLAINSLIISHSRSFEPALQPSSISFRAAWRVWAMAARQDELLVENALRMGLQQRRPQADLLHHTDRGCQYTSQQYQEVLSQHALNVSMSRQGNCFDNAVSESFFGTLKRAWVDHVCFQSQTSQLCIHGGLLPSDPTALLIGLQESRCL